MGQKFGQGMKKNSMLLFLLLIVMIGFTAGRGASGTDKAEGKESESRQEITETERTEELSQTVVYTFRNDKLMQEHFDKHGDEFSYATAEEYVEGANRVIASPEALHKIEQDDGDDVYYLEETNEFVILSKDGYIRTYFKPSAGIDYFNRQ